MNCSMGAVWAKTVGKTFRNFNVENRAQRALEKQEKRSVGQAAPKHRRSKELFDEISKDKALREQLDRKDVDLLARMQELQLLSHGTNPEILSSPKRKLPENRSQMEEEEYGFAMPSFVPPGRITLSQALEFISRHQAEPTAYTAKHIAENIRLDEGTIQQILKHFQMYEYTDPKHDAKKRRALSKTSVIMPNLSEQFSAHSKLNKSLGDPSSDPVLTPSSGSK